MIVGHLKLFTAVQVRHVDLFETSTAGRYVSDTGIEHAGNTRELIDDLVDKFMRDAPVIANSPGVSFTDPLLVLVNVEQPELDCDFVALDRKTAFDQSFRPDRRPIFKV